MASFRTHTFFGVGAGIGLSCYAVMGNYISLAGSVLALFLSVVASALPDIDSDTGSPRKFVLSALEILCPAVLMISAAQKYSLENLLLGGIFVFFVIRYLFGFLVDKLTTHRGAWHSIPMALIVTMFVYLIFYRSAFSVRVFYTLIVFICFLLHLILDEICSLKYFGLSVKRSFGTALKLTGGAPLQTFILYFLTAVFAGLCVIEHIWRNS